MLYDALRDCQIAVLAACVEGEFPSVLVFIGVLAAAPLLPQRSSLALGAKTALCLCTFTRLDGPLQHVGTARCNWTHRAKSPLLPCLPVLPRRPEHQE